MFPPVSRPLKFHLLDVFADRPFRGNPLAVVENADALAPQEMQAIAREFNLSETIFLLEPRNPVHSARVRIFTPQRELAFAGHPTVGATALIAQTRGRDILMRSGLAVTIEADVVVLRCEARRAGDGFVYAQVALPTPPWSPRAAPSAAALAAALSLPEAEIGFGAHRPSVFDAGATFVFVPVKSRAALESAKPDPALFALALRDAIGVYLYTLETLEQTSAIHARMLAHGLGFDEDPATGSAAAAFAGVALAFERPEEGEHEIRIEQGDAMGRPSRITLFMSVENNTLADVAIGGLVCPYGEGVLRL
jgi:trans-2,3-dihydro-3-hydroxyanthranilate isomerase